LRYNSCGSKFLPWFPSPIVQLPFGITAFRHMSPASLRSSTFRRHRGSRVSRPTHLPFPGADQLGPKRSHGPSDSGRQTQRVSRWRDGHGDVWPEHPFSEGGGKLEGSRLS